MDQSWNILQEENKTKPKNKAKTKQKKHGFFILKEKKKKKKKVTKITKVTKDLFQVLPIFQGNKSSRKSSQTKADALRGKATGWPAAGEFTCSGVAGLSAVWLPMSCLAMEQLQGLCGKLRPVRADME